MTMARGGRRPGAGRKGKDTEAHVIAGTFRRDRHGADDLEAANQGAPGLPTPMPGLTSGERREWERLARLLEGERRLTMSDGPGLDVAASAHELMMFIRRRKRRVRGAAWLQLAAAERHAAESYRKALGDLCLNAATRNRAPKVKTEKPVGKLELFRRRKLERRDDQEAS
jgi:hypothetical protein